MEHLELAEQIANAVLLGAYGDCIGGALEGTPIEGRNSAELVLMEPSDDTVLTIATAEAIVASGGVDPGNIAERFVDAYRKGIPGLGSSTLGSLQALAVGQHWALAGIGGDRSAGNGAAMRIAPAAFVLRLDQYEGRRTLQDVARITHRNDEAMTGALAFALAIDSAARDGEMGRAERIDRVCGALPDTVVRDRLLQAAALDPSTSIQAAALALGSGGYVAESVPLAIWIGSGLAHSAVEIVRLAALVSEDADTVASLVGQLLGARGYTLPDTPDLPVDASAIRDLSAALAALSPPSG